MSRWTKYATDAEHAAVVHINTLFSRIYRNENIDNLLPDLSYITGQPCTYDEKERTTWQITWQKALAVSGKVRIYCAVTTDTVENARKIHNMNFTPAVALGRLLTGIALMSQTLKNENDTITIRSKAMAQSEEWWL